MNEEARPGRLQKLSLCVSSYLFLFLILGVIKTYEPPTLSLKPYHSLYLIKRKLPALTNKKEQSLSFCYLLLLVSSVYLNTRQAQERIFNQNPAIALFSLNCLSFIDEGEYLSSSFQHLRLTSSSARYECFMNFIRDYLPKVHFLLTK